MHIDLTECILIKRKDPKFWPLMEMCHLSKNLYNATLYAVRQHFFQTGKYLPYNKLAGMFVKERNIDYYAMPYAQCAQQCMRSVDKAFKSFFAALKSPKMKGKTVHIPGYRDKEGYYILEYTNQTIKEKDGYVILKGIDDTVYEIQCKHSNVRHVRIVPVNKDCIKIEFVYRSEYDIRPDNGRYASIDLGVTNLCTIASTEDNPVIYRGSKLKSINAYWNKKKAEMQSKLPNGVYWSLALSKLNNKRNRRVQNHMHKLSSTITAYLVGLGINTLIIGKNNGWKHKVNNGMANNQNFVCIPHNTLINMLTYKCNIAGINVLTINESYTSKCSFIDKESIGEHKKYAGNRVKRGLFVSKEGRMLNADVNGAYNIMRRGLKKLNVSYDIYSCRSVTKGLMYRPYTRAV